MSTPAAPSGPALLLGAGGFIGSHLAERLLADGGRDVVGVDLRPEKVRHLLPRPRFRYLEFDLADEARLRPLVREAGVVVNLAAICNPARYNTTALATMESNFLAALPVVRLCREEGRRLVHFSTCEVYGRTLASYAPAGSPLHDAVSHVLLSEETTPLLLGPVHRERWCYAAAKQLLERWIRAEGRENGLRWTVIRPFNFIGPRMDFIPGVDGDGTPRVLACFMEALLRDRPLRLVDGGTARRTFVHIDDAVDAVARMLDRPAASEGRTFNVGNPANEVTIAALADAVTAAWVRRHGRPWPHTHEHVTSLEFYGEGYEDSDRRVPDIALARELLGWEPRVPLADALDRTLAAYEEAYGSLVR